MSTLRAALRLLKTAGLVCAAILPGLTQAATLSPPPPAAKHPVTDTYGGVTVTDNYRWLEDFSDPEVKNWSQAQSLRARAYLSSLPQHEALKSRIRRILTETSSSYSDLAYRPGCLFAMMSQPPKQQSFLVVMPSANQPSRARVLLDPNVLDQSGHTAIDFYVPSRDAKYVALSLSQNGSEDGTLHIYVTATGRELPDKIARVTYPTGGGTVAWSGDDSGIFYTRYPHAGERAGRDLYLYQQVYYHRLGTDNSSDKYVLGRDFPAVAETIITPSRDYKYYVAAVANGDGGQLSYYLRSPNGSWTKIAGDKDGIVFADFSGDDSLYLLSRRNALCGKVLRLPTGATSLSAAKLIVPEGSDAIDGILPTQDKLYLFYVVGGPSKMRIVNGDGSGMQEITLPPISSVPSPSYQEYRGNPIWTTGNNVVFLSKTYTRPPAWLRYAPGLRAPVRTSLYRTSPISFRDMDVRREYATSKDGTRVPMTILMRRGTKLNGDNPTIIYGYGGYGINETPEFRPLLRLWLDHGGIYVDTNIRGGGEFGEAWHRGGNLLNKQNVFDDFAACAQHIIARGYTNPKRLAARGGSNGGLLMGAMITQHPELFKCVVSFVGVYDMLRSEIEPNGAFNVTEYGSVKNPAQFKALYAYSPYHNVVDGRRYPDILFVAGDNDGRVDPMQSRKMMARLQAAAAPGSKLLLRTSATSGHGIGNSLDEDVNENADVYAFLFDELGMR